MLLLLLLLLLLQVLLLLLGGSCTPWALTTRCLTDPKNMTKITYFSQSRTQNRYIFFVRAVTPQGKKRYFCAVI